MIPVCEIANWGMGRELKNQFPQFGNGKGLKKNIPIIRELEGNEKSIPKFQEWEGNEKIHSHNSGKGIRGSHSWDGREREFPLTPGLLHVRSLREEK